MTFLIIDGNSIASRAFFTQPNTLFSILQKAISEVKPHYFVIAFDSDGPTFRHALYPEYKASREHNIERSAFCRKTRESFQQSGLPALSIEGYEADDICYTMACIAWYQGIDAVIMSGDRDLLQAITASERASIKARYPTKGVNGTIWNILDAEAARALMGVEPWQIPFLKALEGDKSDNIPGIKGIGPVAAQKIIDEYQSARVFLDSVENGASVGATFTKSIYDFFSQPGASDKFLLWCKLAHLTDVPFDDFDLSNPDWSKFRLDDYKDFSAPLFSEAARLLLGKG